MTMVQVIKFEIADFKNGTIEEFVVANNSENFTKIAGSRFTRAITFDRMLDFQFEKEENIPVGFIDPTLWTAIVQSEEFLAELDKELRDSAPEVPEEIETVEETAPVAEEKVLPKKNYYAVYECIGSVKKQIRTCTSQKIARASISELRSMNPSRKYKWEKI